MKKYFLLLLIYPLLSGCPINERGYITRWWNGETFTEYKSKDGAIFSNKEELNAYEKLSTYDKELIHKNKIFCGKNTVNIMPPDKRNLLYEQCLDDLNTPKYFNSKTGKYERF